MNTCIFFDLDGTLTDSSEGITKCAHLALTHFGITDYKPNQLTDFIGPPLRDTFPRYGVPKDNVEEAVSLFRSRYNTVGKFENKPYEGIAALLADLKKDGFLLFVATSKPESTAKEILKKFDLDQYFEIICGASFDGRIDSKESVIKYLLSNLDDTNHILMIGDTKFDVLGANAHNIKTIGVNWGFGSEKEMRDAGAVAIADTPKNLYTLIKNFQFQI